MEMVRHCEILIISYEAHQYLERDSVFINNKICNVQVHRQPIEMLLDGVFDSREQ